jgi:hypothetical protein
MGLRKPIFKQLHLLIRKRRIVVVVPERELAVDSRGAAVDFQYARRDPDGSVRPVTLAEGEAISQQVRGTRRGS